MRLNWQFWRSNKTQRKNRKPLNTSFRQQRLKAWQPNLSPEGMLPLLIIIACIFAPIGAGLLVSTLNTQTLTINYEQCHLQATVDFFQPIPDKYVQSAFHKSTTIRPKWRLIQNNNSDKNNLTCQLQFQIPNDISSSLYVYYRLTNYYQNHRKYIESFDLDQLKGEPLLPHQLDDNCKPFKEIDGKAIYPCGVIANTMFNDTFSDQLTNVDNTELSVTLTNEGTGWHTDRHRYKPTKYNASQIVPPPNWSHSFPNGYTDDNIPNLQTWPEFQVWMRTAALPKFYKLALHNVSGGLVLRKGFYTMDINLNYPVLSFNGTKAFVLTNSHIVGARNIVLSIIYFIIAGVAMVFAIIFFMSVLLKPKKTTGGKYLRHSEPHIGSSAQGISTFASNDSNYMDNLQMREIL